MMKTPFVHLFSPEIIRFGIKKTENGQSISRLANQPKESESVFEG